MRGMKMAGSIVTTALMLGCATAGVPQERLTASQGALRAAEAVGADKVPPAALHLQLAREQIDKAQEQIKAGHNAHADMTLQRAEADAELSIALAHEAPLREQAQQAMDKLQALKSKTTP